MNNDFLNVAKLSRLGVRPQWFGLGFIQLKLSENQRLHFWHDRLKPNSGHEEEAHNHRYDFHSTVLKGELLDELWQFHSDPHGEWNMWRVSCQPGDSGDAAIIGRVGITSITPRRIATNQTYFMPETCFHRTFPQGSVVTCLNRGPVIAERALVIRPVGKEHICPFRVVMSEDELWSIIEEIIDE